MARKKVKPKRTFAQWREGRLRALRRRPMRCDYVADGLGVSDRNLSFLDDPVFAAAWDRAAQLGLEGWQGAAPDIRWRAHVAVWCASNGLQIEGDFVECGVHTGLLSVTICETLKFAGVPKSFWLFDTWSGIPVDTLGADEKQKAAQLNADNYRMNIHDIATRNFAPYPNAKLVRGVLPGTLSEATIEKIAYLSIDLNNRVAEEAVIEALWPKVTPGGMVLLDDYGLRGFEQQYAMWNAFAERVGRRIVTLPTGQGVLVK
jgi:hypothetical protein